MPRSEPDADETESEPVRTRQAGQEVQPESDRDSERSREVVEESYNTAPGRAERPAITDQMGTGGDVEDDDADVEGDHGPA